MMKSIVRVLVLAAIAGGVMMFNTSVNAAQASDTNIVAQADLTQNADLNLNDEASDNWYGGWGLGGYGLGLGWGLGFGGCGFGWPWYSFYPWYYGCGGCFGGWGGWGFGGGWGGWGGWGY